MPDYLKAAGYVALMLMIVPLAGAAVTGSWRGAWRYSKDWLRSMGILLAIGLVLSAVILLIGFL